MRKKIRWIFVSVILVSMLIMMGAGKTQSDKKPVYSKYYVNAEETELLKKEFEVEDESTEGLIREIVSSLNSREVYGKGNSLLPSEVEIEAYKIEEDILKLTFNENYGMMGRAREILVRTGISKSFFQIPGISEIHLMIGEEELTDSKGKIAGRIQRDTFVELEGSDENAYRYDTFTLYFADENGKKLLPETRTVYYKRSISKTRVIVEQLIKGPIEKNHYPTLPGEMQVVDIDVLDKIAYITFDKLFTEEKVNIEENVIIHSVVHSLITNLDIDKVQILIDGEKNPILGKETQLYNFYEWDEELMEKKENS